MVESIQDHTILCIKYTKHVMNIRNNNKTIKVTPIKDKK